MGHIRFCDHCKRASTILKPGELKTYRLFLSDIDRKEDKILKQAELCNDCYEAMASYFDMGDGKIRMSESDVTKDKYDKEKISLKPGTHTYHFWSKEEDDFILNHSAGMTKKEMAMRLGVTVPAISARKWRLLKQEG